MNFSDLIKKVMSVLTAVKIFVSKIGKKIVAFVMFLSRIIKQYFPSQFFAKIFGSVLFKKVAFILVVIFALCQVVFAVLIYGFKFEDKVTKVASKIIPFPVAVANYSFISYSEYLNEKDYIHHFYKSTQGDKVDFTEIDKEILNQLVENKLIKEKAFALRVKVKSADIDQAMNEIIEQNGGEDQVKKVLSDLYGIDLKQFRKLVGTQMLRDKINDEMIAKVTVRHILVRLDQNAPEDKVNEAKTKIDGYLNEIKNGLDFGEAAKKYSEDIGSAEQGGSLEPFSSGEMVEEFSKTAFSTPVGSISEPFRTEFGWHILKVENKTGKIEKSFTDWLEEIKKNSLIVKLF